MILHGYWRSSAAWRVRIALNLKGVAARHAFRHLRRDEQRAPDYLKLNPQGLVPARRDDFVDGLRPEPRHPQEHFALGAIHVDREAMAVLERPGELRIDLEVEHAVLGNARDLLRVEGVMAQEPVGLVEPVLALQRRRLQRQNGARIRDRAEGRIIDALEVVARVEKRGLSQHLRVGGCVGADDHLR